MSELDPTPGNVAAKALSLGRELTVEQAGGLAAYLGLLQAWNRKTNLVGPRVWNEMLSELVADSWHLADLLAGLELPAEPATLDFGAGAGIPGIPLRLFWPVGRYVLIEPRAKRAAFLRQCAAMLRLPRTEVFEGRGEAVKLRADICLSRAFQPWREFLETARGYAGDAAAGNGQMGDAAGKSGGDGPGVMRALVFSSVAAPDGPLPEGYLLERVHAYPKKGGQGWLWVFRLGTG
jgi:16S rRNA (guanine527-N7)-methyltransferase